MILPPFPLSLSHSYSKLLHPLWCLAIFSFLSFPLQASALPPLHFNLAEHSIGWTSAGDGLHHLTNQDPKPLGTFLTSLSKYVAKSGNISSQPRESYISWVHQGQMEDNVSWTQQKPQNSFTYAKNLESLPSSGTDYLSSPTSATQYTSTSPLMPYCCRTRRFSACSLREVRDQSLVR